MYYKEIACFDVYYYETYAKACAVVFKVKPKEEIISEYFEIITEVQDYVPGSFYKRELPCLLLVHRKIKEEIGLIIIDGYVTLGKDSKGLGWHLHHALKGEIPVIGVAKSLFKGSIDYIEIYRGQSRVPLYITSIGIERNFSAKFIAALSGRYRIPSVLKRVDQLTKMI